MNYTDLVKKIRHCATDPMHCLTCDEDKDGRCFARLMRGAADAIEALQTKVKKMDTQVEALLCLLIRKDDTIEALSKMENTTPKWIPVTERLPKLHEKVLVCNGEYGLSGLGFATVAVWDGTDWIETWDRRTAIHYVTHWMPLPEPPEEETE